MIDKRPKIFISYAWGNKEVKDRVKELVERLRHDGVDVVLDIWDLKEGQDKYAFMEQSVNDETIDRVLIICDKVYKNKADNREGGVGDETVIISPEVYKHNQQSKYIPVIFERDENGETYIPTYISSRMYIEFSLGNEDDYEQLLRMLYEKPLNKKPPLGEMPSWLLEDNSENIKMEGEVRKLKKANENGRWDFAKNNARKFTDIIINALNEQQNVETFKKADAIDKVKALKKIRDCVFEYIEELAANEELSAEFLIRLFERLYNETPKADGVTYSQSNVDCFAFFRWELFIGVTAILLNYESYSILYEILKNTYFLRSNFYSGSEQRPSGYLEYNRYIDSIEENKSHFDKNYFSKIAFLLCGREKYPILTKDAMARADLVLYQLSTVFDIVSYRMYNFWFPYMYSYVKGDLLWKRLVSRRQCEKIMPLFGVDNIIKLKNLISQAKHDSGVRFSGAFNAAPNILDYIKEKDIGTLP